MLLCEGCVTIQFQGALCWPRLFYMRGDSAWHWLSVLKAQWHAHVCVSHSFAKEQLKEVVLMVGRQQLEKPGVCEPSIFLCYLAYMRRKWLWRRRERNKNWAADFLPWKKYLCNEKVIHRRINNTHSYTHPSRDSQSSASVESSWLLLGLYLLPPFSDWEQALSST